MPRRHQSGYTTRWLPWSKHSNDEEDDRDFGSIPFGSATSVNADVDSARGTRGESSTVPSGTRQTIMLGPHSATSEESSGLYKAATSVPFQSKPGTDEVSQGTQQFSANNTVPTESLFHDGEESTDLYGAGITVPSSEKSGMPDDGPSLAYSYSTGTPTQEDGQVKAGVTSPGTTTTRTEPITPPVSPSHEGTKQSTQPVQSDGAIAPSFGRHSKSTGKNRSASHGPPESIAFPVLASGEPVEEDRSRSDDVSGITNPSAIRTIVSRLPWTQTIEEYDEEEDSERTPSFWKRNKRGLVCLAILLGVGLIVAAVTVSILLVGDGSSSPEVPPAPGAPSTSTSPPPSTSTSPPPSTPTSPPAPQPPTPDLSISGAQVSISRTGAILVVGARDQVQTIRLDTMATLGGLAGSPPGGNLVLDLSEDGSKMIIGAANAGLNGRVQVWLRDVTSDLAQWTLLGNELDGGTTGGLFGTSVAISADGFTVAVGAPGENAAAGQVILYQLPGLSGQWSVVASVSGDMPGDAFGASVSLSSDGMTLAVGAPQRSIAAGKGYVQMYTMSSMSLAKLGTSIQGDNAGDRFGISVSLSGDASVVAVGAWGSDAKGEDSGQARVFSRAGSTWSPLGNTISGDTSGDALGYSVSLLVAGTTYLAVGAPQSFSVAKPGYVRVYEFTGGLWTLTGTYPGNPGEQLGSSVSLGADSTFVYLGWSSAFLSDGSWVYGSRSFEN